MRSLKPARTEQRNPRSRGLDRKSSAGDRLRALNREDASVAPAVRRELPQIARAVDAIVKSLRARRNAFLRRRGNQRPAGGAGRGGMPADVRHAAADGAGNHRRGRASSAPRGGRRGRFSARTARAICAARGLTRGDVVVGIAASGTTPYVLGALEFARRRGAVTVGVTSNPRSPLARKARISIAPDTGPEAIVGLDAPEGRDRAEDGPEHAFYRCDGAARQSLRELDGSRGADKSEVAAPGRADSAGSRRRERVCRGTRSASGRTTICRQRW